MSARFDAARAAALARPAGVLPGSALRVGFDARGRFSASRFPATDVGALVLTDERPTSIVPDPHQRHRPIRRGA